MNQQELGCTHFTYFDVAGLCWLKNQAEPTTNTGGVLTASIACLDPYVENGPVPPVDPPYSIESCYETGAVYAENTDNNVQIL